VKASIFSRLITFHFAPPEKQKKPPRILAEEIYTVDEFDEGTSGDRTGRAFYPAKQWWQFWK
jgi:hypothetical protein